MWKDDPFWFPLLFLGKTFRGYFLFRGHDQIIKGFVTPIKSLPWGLGLSQADKTLTLECGSGIAVSVDCVSVYLSAVGHVSERMQ